MFIMETLAIGVLTSVLSGMLNEVSKLFISIIWSDDVRIQELRATLDLELSKLKIMLESMYDHPSQCHPYFRSDWLDKLEQLRYDLEDIRDSDDRDFVMKSLEINIDRVTEMQTVLEDTWGYRPSLGQNGKCPLEELPADEILRVEEKKEIIEELKNGSDSFGVSIIGICGLGKTTLAKAIANEDSIRTYFPCIITPKYVPNFNLGSILDYIKGQKPSKYRRVLILLDGIPALNPRDWIPIRSLLSQSGPGSKVLITTQNPKVADVTNTSAHFLDPLSDDECFKLLEKLANANGELSAPDKSAINHNRAELASKCRGLPLLANEIGLTLSSVKERDLLCTIKEITSPLSPGLDGVLLNLKSASLQKPHLKRCLAYFSLFPQDFEFTKDNLVQFWMAEGFNQCSKTEKDVSYLRDATEQNFLDLQAYSFLQTSKSPRPEETSYRMHKLAYDLAQHVAAKTFCPLTFCRKHIGESSPTDISEVTRHFSLSFKDGKSYNDVVENLLSLIKDKCLRLRTFLLVHGAGIKISKNPTFFKSLTHLRVLDLSHTNLTNLRHISKLKYLRYMDLSYTPIETLPKLSNNPALQVLKLINCDNLFALPDLDKMTCLVCLQVNKSGLGSMPRSIGKLSNLQKLDVFTVGNETGFKIVELKNLNGLTKSLHIAQLENVKDNEEAQNSDLQNKVMLDRLELEWTSLSEQKKTRKRKEMSLTPEEDANLKQVFEGLVPPKNLEELIIRNYYGSAFPQWLNTTEVCGLLKSIHLDRCEVVPSVDRLPCLKTFCVEAMDKTTHLDLIGMNGTIGQGFPYIELLVLCGMPELNQWIKLAANHMPRLCDLRVDKCTQLKELPPLNHLTSLEKLQINRCTQLEKLPTLLPSSLRSIIIKNSGIPQQEADGPKSRGIQVEIDSAAAQNTVGLQSSSTQQGSSSRKSPSWAPALGIRGFSRAKN